MPHVARFSCGLVTVVALQLFGVAQATVREQLTSLTESLQGKRIGLVINPGSCDEAGRPDLDFFLQAKGTTVTAFFAPEHGVRADVQYGVKIEDAVDPATSIPVYAIYRTRNAPTVEQLAKLDALVYDLTDVGVRFWTYTWSMTFCMEAAAEAGKPFYIIDRPNPIGGLRVEGMPNAEDFKLLGRVPDTSKLGVPTRHGMTLGEIATWWNAEHMNGRAELHVVRMTKWKRAEYWDEAGRHFVKRSPNMRTLSTAIVYPGTCIFEGSTLSEGRGTTAPYELIGAPFVDAERWCAAIREKALPGVTFEPASYVPESSKFAGERCHGVKLTVTDRAAFQPMRTALHMLKLAIELYPGQAKVTPFAARLMGDPEIAKRITTQTPEAILSSWDQKRDEFLPIRAKYLLY